MALVATVALAVPTAYAVTGDTVVAGDSAQQDVADGAQGDATGTEGDTVGDAGTDADAPADAAAGVETDGSDDATAGEGQDAGDGASDGEGAGSDVDKSQVPQALSDAPSPRSNSLDVDTDRSTNNGITVNLFDYDAQTDNLNDGINAHHDLKFTGGSVASEDWNKWTGRENFGDSSKQGGVYQGIVGNQLDANGYPVLNVGDEKESLQYLFDESENASGVGVAESHLGVEGLFSYDEETGFYDYDSAKNFATLNDDGESFKVYETGRFNGGLPYQNGAFMPFDDLTNEQAAYDGPNGAITGYKLDGVSNTGDDNGANYFFGMTVEAQFYMPKDRTINDQDMVFEFSGDDDVWVFIDGRLALDLGGIHDDYSGSINFATGAIEVERVYNHNGKNQITSLSDVLGEDWDTAYQQHTLKVFYLERGRGSSNCKLHFNLPTIPRGNASFAKAVSGDAGEGQKYDFTVELDADGMGEYTPYKGKYRVYDLNTREPVGEEQTVGNDGSIQLENGQYATLLDDITVNSQFKVTELNAANYTVLASNNVAVTKNDDGSATTGDVKVEDVPMLTITNVLPLGEVSRLTPRRSATTAMVHTRLRWM